MKQYTAIDVQLRYLILLTNIFLNKSTVAKLKDIAIKKKRWAFLSENLFQFFIRLKVNKLTQ